MFPAAVKTVGCAVELLLDEDDAVPDTDWDEAPVLKATEYDRRLRLFIMPFDKQGTPGICTPSQSSTIPCLISAVGILPRDPDSVTVCPLTDCVRPPYSAATESVFAASPFDVRSVPPSASGCGSVLLESRSDELHSICQLSLNLIRGRQ